MVSQIITLIVAVFLLYKFWGYLSLVKAMLSNKGGQIGAVIGVLLGLLGSYNSPEFDLMLAVISIVVTGLLGAFVGTNIYLAWLEERWICPLIAAIAIVWGSLSEFQSNSNVWWWLPLIPLFAGGLAIGSFLETMVRSLLESSAIGERGDKRTRKWVLGVVAPVALPCEETTKTFMSEFPLKMARDLLESSWGIDSRESAQRKLLWLKEEGHQAEYRRLSPEERKRSGGGMHSSPVTIQAWDYARLIQVARWSCRAEYITLEEAWDHCLGVIVPLQSTYQSWEEFSDAFEYGLRFWLANEAPSESSLDTLEWLRTAKKSPWKRVSWQVNLVRSS